MNPTESIAHLYTLVDQRPFNLSETKALFAESFVDHNRPEAPDFLSDADVTMGLFAELATAFPDGRHELLALSNLSNLSNLARPANQGSDQAMVYWRFTGTHQNPFFGTEPHGNAVSIFGVDIFQVSESGEFVAQWHVEQLAQLAAQLSPS
jgi:predicted ester cyclase